MTETELDGWKPLTEQPYSDDMTVLGRLRAIAVRFQARAGCAWTSKHENTPSALLAGFNAQTHLSTVLQALEGYPPEDWYNWFRWTFASWARKSDIFGALFATDRELENYRLEDLRQRHPSPILTCLHLCRHDLSGA